MKNALYLLLLVCSFGHAQRLIVTADGLKNSTDPAKSYVVIEADSLNSKQLYTKAMNYIQKN